ncbi:4133_t:CDS:1, partial [Dentiscutata erythropus]
KKLQKTKKNQDNAKPTNETASEFAAKNEGILPASSARKKRKTPRG